MQNAQQCGYQKNLRKIENAQQFAYWKKNEKCKCVAMWKK